MPLHSGAALSYSVYRTHRQQQELLSPVAVSQIAVFVHGCAQPSSGDRPQEFALRTQVAEEALGEKKEWTVLVGDSRRS